MRKALILVCLLLAFPVSVFATGEEGGFLGALNGQHVTDRKSTTPESDLSTGALSYQVPIQISPGRNGMQPDIALSYNNQNADGMSNIFGYGWSVSVPYIERINRTGIENLYTAGYFRSSLSGELVMISSGSYGPKTDTSDFARYTLASNSWSLVDKKGTTYLFGQTASAQQDSADHSKKYKWMLQRATDLNGNFITYEYFKDDGQIYPATISWTGFGQDEGIFKLAFGRTSRTDADAYYAAGFRVQNNYRINQIEATVNGAWVKRYDMTHGVGDNGRRLTLARITESGQAENGTVTTLPPIQFSYAIPEQGWEIDTDGTPPDFFVGKLLGDVNTDGFTDIVQSAQDCFQCSPDQQHRETFLFTDPGGFVTASPQFVPPPYFYHPYTSPPDGAWRMDDLNGDFKSDLYGYHQQSGNEIPREVQLNDGTGWVVSSSWHPQVPIIRIEAGVPKITHLFDANGDGLPDVFESGTGYELNRFNTGYGWTSNSGISLPVPFTEGTYVLDVNGDGLNDLVQSFIPSNPCGGNGICGAVWLHTGTGWEKSDAWATVSFDFGDYNTDTGARVADINGDALPDLIETFCDGGGSKSRIYLNTGAGWTYESGWDQQPFITCGGSDSGFRIIDFTGDGMPDISKSGGGATPVRNRGKRADQLERIIFPQGGTSTIAYAGSHEYRDAQDYSLSPRLPTVLQTVKSIRVDSGVGPVALTSYSYEQGEFYYGGAFDRRVSGFGKVTKTDSASNTTTYFHQGNTASAAWGEPTDHKSKIGKPFRVDTLDKLENLYKRVWNNWTSVELGPERWFVETASTQEQLYDGNGTHKDKTTSYSHDLANGNLASKTEAGDDSATFTTTYAYASSSQIFLPKQITKKNQSNVTIQETKNYYDNSAFGLLTNGNLTKQEQWASASLYIDTERSYNSYGLVTEEKDPRDNITSLSYDAFSLYPVRMENALGHLTSSSFDYSSGKVRRMHDPNGSLYETRYDGLDRILEERQPDPPQEVTSGEGTALFSVFYPSMDGRTWRDTNTSSFTGIVDGAGTSADDSSTTGELGLLRSNDSGNWSQLVRSFFLFNTAALPNDDAIDSAVFSFYATDKSDLGNQAVSFTDVSPTATTSLQTADHARDMMPGHGITRQATDRDITGVITDTYSDFTLNATGLSNISKTGITKFGAMLSSDRTRTEPSGIGGGVNHIAQVGSNFSEYTGTSRDPMLVVEHSDPDSGYSGRKTLYRYTDTPGTVRVKTSRYLDGATVADAYTYYDGLGRKLQERAETEDDNFAVRDYLYNNRNMLEQESLPYFSTGEERTASTSDANLYTTYTHDALGRPTKVANAIGSSSYAYDDRRVTQTDPRGNPKNTYADVYGNLVKVEEFAPGATYSTNYEYNGNQNLTKITDALGNIRNFTYNGLGQRLTAQDLHDPSDATFGTWTYAYDPAGNVSSSFGPKGQTVQYTYDALNRVLTENYTGQSGTEITYTYDTCTDGVGRLCSVIAPGASSSYQYDDLGKRSRERMRLANANYQTDFTYDRQGNPVGITSPDSSQVQYLYNSAGSLDSLRRKESTDPSFIDVISDVDYHASGKPSYQLFANGVSTSYAYDPTKAYRLQSKTTETPGSSKIQKLSYAYDPNSNITHLTDDSSTSTEKLASYSYDSLNRLTSASVASVSFGSPFTHTFSYDPIGNITSKSDTGLYSYATQSFGGVYANPHAVYNISSLASFSYDSIGNLTSSTGASLSWTYDNRLASFKSSSASVSYAYDHLGNRVKLRSGTSSSPLVSIPTTYYPTRFYNYDGSTHLKHLFTPDGILVATLKGTGASLSLHFVHTDHLGGTQVTTTASGSLETTTDYYEYGELRLNQGNPSEQRKYTGHEYDPQTNLNYMQARYQSGEWGRFVSVDPSFLAIGDARMTQALTGRDQQQILADPQSLNSFSYARNNPIVNTDPTGNFWWYGFYNWSGYDGLRGVGMKALEVLGGHSAGLNAITQNQNSINQASAKYGVDSTLANAVTYEEQSHLLNLPGLPFESAKDYLAPNSQVGGYDGGVGVMQVSGNVAKDFGYTKTEVARDPTKNINAGVGYLGSIGSKLNTKDPATIGAKYNGAAAYGQRVAAQVNNPSYNTNIVKDVGQKISNSIKSLAKSFIK